MVYDLLVIGGGAAGFFGAIQAAEMKKGLRIVIVEKSPKLLSKVKVSGGGRCNVTHGCFDSIVLSTHYPRGEKFLRNIFKQYQARHVVDWFQSKGVQLKVEEDGRMFPTTNNSQTIIDCFMREAHRHSIKIELSEGVVSVDREDSGFNAVSDKGKNWKARKILIACGGNPKQSSYDWIQQLGHTIASPIPSLFTFNNPNGAFQNLMGISIPDAEIKIAGTSFLQRGPLLITHWGLSGPAVIKLSAWAAEYLHKEEYQFTVLVSWIGPMKEEELRAFLLNHKSAKGKQKVWNNPLFNLPQRLWEKLCALAQIEQTKIWAELPQKNLNKLLEAILRCPFEIKGKTTFKEEFVTCGGVDLKEVDVDTMQSKKVPGIYFAGEVLNVDGETGGFNFQAAWSTAFLAARAICSV